MGKRWHEFVEWHVALPAEWQNYAHCSVRRMTQRNKFNPKDRLYKSIYYFPRNYAIHQVALRTVPQSNVAFSVQLPIELNSYHVYYLLRKHPYAGYLNLFCRVAYIFSNIHKFLHAN